MVASKLYMRTQTHYMHDEDGRTALVVRGHGSVPLNHSGNVVTRLGLHTSSVDLAHYGVSCAKDWVSVDCGKKRVTWEN